MAVSDRFFIIISWLKTARSVLDICIFFRILAPTSFEDPFGAISTSAWNGFA
jgi:hypothetical protein